MRRATCRDAYKDNSRQASKNARTLAITGVAIVWAFGPAIAGPQAYIPNTLLVALGAFVLSLCCDFLQYLYATAAWGTLHRMLEKRGVDDDTDFKAPAAINWPTNSLFFSKATLTATGYIFVLIYLYSSAVQH